MADYLVTDTELTSIADAIRTKGGTSANLSFPTEFVSAINAIETGGDLEYEAGEVIPTSDSYEITINFSDSHTKAPFCAFIWDRDLDNTTAVGTTWWWHYFSMYNLLGSSAPPYVSNNAFYGQVYYVKHYDTGVCDSTYNKNCTSYSDTNSTGTLNTGYYASNTRLHHYDSGSSKIQFRRGRTYKWIAIWK